MRNLAGYRSVPHHHGEAETGGYVLSGRARIYFGEKFEDYLDMSEGDWVFVPPFMPHVECNLDRNNPLTWMTDPDAGEHRGQPAAGRRRRPARLGGPPVTAASTPSPTSQTFTDAVALTECDAEVFDRAFTATTQPCPWPKAYGGDMVAQALVAAVRSPSTDGKTMHSMHSYFMRPVDIGAEVRYEVEVLRDGRGYSTRQVRGFQNGKPVYVCLAELRGRRAERQLPGRRRPPTCPGPDDLPSVRRRTSRTAPAAR